MSYVATSDLRGPAVGTSAGWASVLTARGADEPDTIAALYFHLAPLVGLNPDLALAQAALETGWFRSPAWLERRNPAGLGITADGVPGEDLRTMARGIQAHLAHLCCYVYAAADCPIERGLPWHDPRHFFHDATPTLGDLRGDKHQWAADPEYIDKILRVVATALAAMGAPAGPADGPEAILARAHQGNQARLGARRQTGSLRRPAWGDNTAESYPMLLCERGLLIVVNQQARDVTARAIDEFVTLSEQRGTFQRF